MQRVRRRLQRFARLDLPVLVRGQTGTGKELAARVMHETGPRADRPFVAVNCATVSEELAHSQLFGHVRGSFTGAQRDHRGAFCRAEDGTLFLDEVGELSLPLQATLLRALENRVFVPLGGEIEHSTRARVIAATHRELEQMVADGTFREDLYHRLAVLWIRLPALSERTEDIPELVEHLRRSAEVELGRPLRISTAAVEAACRHPWRGNVRGLKNAILRAGALADGMVGPELLLLDDLSPRPRPAPPQHAHDSLGASRGDYRTMNRALLERAVLEHGSINRAAEALGIPRSTLSAWLRRLRAA